MRRINFSPLSLLCTFSPYTLAMQYTICKYIYILTHGYVCTIIRSKICWTFFDEYIQSYPMYFKGCIAFNFIHVEILGQGKDVH